MTPENQAKLLQAYKFATEANQDGIADLLEDVILGEMEHEKSKVTRDMNEGKARGAKS